MAKRIVMIVDNACAPDPRVLKESSALTNAGFAVTVLAWDRLGLQATVDHVGATIIKRIRILSGHQRRFRQLLPMMRFWFATIRRALAEQFEYVHSHDLPSLVPGVVVSMIRRRPLVYDAHEIYWMQDGTKFPTHFQTLLKVFEILLLKFVRDVITVSAPCADYFRRYHHRVSVVGNWYDAGQISKEARSTARETLGLDDQDFCLVSVGTLATFRLIGLLLQSAELDSGLHVVLAGRGGLVDDIVAASRRLSNVHYLGWIEDPQIAFAAADAIFYGLSRDDPYSSISSPNALFQAIALEIPLVTTRSGEAGSVIGLKGGGIVLTEASPECLLAAIESLGSESVARTAREHLRELQSTYNWQSASETLLAVYAR